MDVAIHNENATNDVLNVDRILCVYENQPLSPTSTHAVPRLLSQLIEGLAVDSDSEFVAISPKGGTIAGVKNRNMPSLSGLARLQCRIVGSRFVRKLRPQKLESTIPYQRAKRTLGQCGADENTIVIAATMSAVILAKQVCPASRVVYWVQGMPRLGQEAMASRAVNAADVIVAPSKAIYRDLFQLVCRDRFAPPVWVIPNTIDRSQFTPEPQQTIARTRAKLDLHEDDIAVMHIGRAPEKGLQVVQAALAIGKFDRNVVLVSAGGKHEGRRRIHERAEVLEIGRVTPSELNQVYQACNFGVVPSVWWENCPLALIEMMSLGLCPIGSRVGGIPEMIDHGVTGLIVDAPNDPHAWARAMEKLVTNRGLRERMGTEAKRSAQHQFSQAASLAQWRQVINTLTAIA
jgi:glycosyltransferase involved in cell wall biosynthesis